MQDSWLLIFVIPFGFIYLSSVILLCVIIWKIIIKTLKEIK